MNHCSTLEDVAKDLKPLFVLGQKIVTMVVQCTCE